MGYLEEKPNMIEPMNGLLPLGIYPQSVAISVPRYATDSQRSVHRTEEDSWCYLVALGLNQRNHPLCVIPRATRHSTPAEFERKIE